MRGKDLVHSGRHGGENGQWVVVLYSRHSCPSITGGDVDPRS